MTALAVVLVGAPRSGTYWVVDILQQRFGVHIPSETHFIPLFGRFLWLWGDLSVVGNRRRLLKNIYEFLQLWTPRSADSQEYLAQIRRLSLLVTLDEGRAERIVSTSSDYASLVQAMFQEFADIHGAASSGDKSAHYKALDPQLTLQHFPDALMLHVIRDGRDVALSWMKQWFGPSTLATAACRWVEHIEVNRQWGQKHPARYLEIRYEDLASDAEEEIAKLARFLDSPALPVSAEPAQSALARALSETDSHAGMLNIVASENVGKWKVGMAEPDVARFSQIAGTQLTMCGYEDTGTAGQRGRTKLPDFSAHTLRVAAKTLLPLVLGCCGRMGITILPLLNKRFEAQWRAVKFEAARDS